MCRAKISKKRKAAWTAGCEDPRLTKIGSTMYLAYTAFNGVDPWRAALSSISVKDFIAKRWDKWQKPQLITPDPVQDKDTCILPEKIKRPVHGHASHRPDDMRRLFGLARL